MPELLTPPALEQAEVTERPGTEAFQKMLNLYVDAMRLGADEARELKADWQAYARAGSAQNEWQQRVCPGWEPADFQTLLHMVDSLEKTQPLKTGNPVKRFLNRS